jgi:dTDP-4-amino-4,6-dideoxygalactose transaminase
MGLMSSRYDEWERPMVANYQLSVGNVQFKRSSKMTHIRRGYTALLNKKLNDNYKLPDTSNKDISWNCQYYVISVKNNMNVFFDQMFDRGVHLMKEDVWNCSAYEFSKDIIGDFPVAKKYNPTLIRIPNSSFLSKKDVVKIADKMNCL